MVNSAMVGVVIMAAEPGKVVEVGVSVLEPWVDVVGFEVHGGVAAGIAADSVAIEHGAAGVWGHDVVGPADIDRDAFGLPQRSHDTVAQQRVEDRVGQGDRR